MLGQTAGIEIEAVDQFGNLAILRFNHLLPPFDNLEMRRALLPGIDQMAVVQAVVGDQAEFGRTPVGFFTAVAPMANDAGIQAITLTIPLGLGLAGVVFLAVGGWLALWRRGDGDAPAAAQYAMADTAL